MIVGLGNIGLLYDLNRTDITWSHTAALLKDTRYNLVAGVDVNMDNQATFQSLTKKPTFSCISDAIESINETIEVVVIASPTRFHYPMYKEIKETACKTGCKLILLEKPISESTDEVDLMLAESESGPKVWVNLFRLYQSQVNSYLELLSESDCCDISVIYSKGIVHNGIHFLSLLMKHYEGDITIHKTGNESIINIGSGNVAVRFTESINKLDNNSMIIHSNIGSLYYLNGGRHSFFIDTNHCKINFSEYEFKHYQSCVYNKIYNYIEGKYESDDSLNLAAKSQFYLKLLEGDL